MIKTASGTITVWLPSSGDACAHEAYCSLVPDGGGAPTGDVLVWWLDSWQEGEVPPFVNKHKFEVIAAVNWQALGAADAQDSYEITLTGDDGFEEFRWSIVYDTNSRSMSARIGDASIEHVTDAYEGAFCVSVMDTAWHGTAALPEYDGLRFEDIALNGDPVDADELDEYVTAYLHPSGVDLHIIGDGNTVRFTVDEEMASGLFSWGEEWCESLPGDPHLAVDYAGRVWLAFRSKGNIVVYDRDSPQRPWRERTPAFQEHDHTAPCIMHFPDQRILVTATRWGGHSELMESRDYGHTWSRPT